MNGENSMKSCKLIFLLLLILLTCSCKKSENRNSTTQLQQNVPNNTSSTDEFISENNNKTFFYNNLFSYTIEKDSIKITETDAIKNPIVEKQMVIPEEIDGLPVKSIGNNAFYQYKDVKCFVLPQNLSKIEYGAFYRCYSLETITIPENVNFIDYETFFRCSSLSEINVEPKNEHYSDVDGVLFNKEKTILHTYPEGKKDNKYTIPSTVREIGDSAFGYRCYHLKEIVIPKNVTIFPDYNIFVFPNDILLCVEPNSAAEKYAKEHQLRYETK